MTGIDATSGQALPGKLSDMVAAVQRAGTSYAKMAADSKGPAGERGMSKAWFQRLAVGSLMSAPKPEELEAVARGIRKPIRLVKEAAASQWLEWESVELSGYDEDMRHIIIRAAAMDPRERRRLRVMLDAAASVDENSPAVGQ
ncbi:hypothetical protein [Kitasatospora griseola]|uniref:Uncharacterized protein n=1 Tax=Kitasatospora griseola TaxID=2064 RepID=A0A0D0PX68_KITGR|nr:hypothetical protein [Kitasatospora griseola]KIQ67014.1 hypothetical protein TR51_06380 [Kitasatospora griseola]